MLLQVFVIFFLLLHWVDFEFKKMDQNVFPIFVFIENISKYHKVSFNFDKLSSSPLSSKFMIVNHL